MSISPLRRAIFVAASVLAIGGTLALAGTASAFNSQTVVPTEITAAQGGLVLGYAALDELQVGAAANPFGTTAYSATTPQTIAAAAEGAFPTTYPGSATGVSAATTVEDFWAYGGSDGTPATSGSPTSTEQTELAAAASAIATDLGNTSLEGLTYAQYAALIAQADAGYAEMSQLLGLASDDPTDFPNGLFSIDGDLTVHSSETITAPLTTAAFSMGISATGSMTGGYILPAAFTMTIPTGYALNSALANVVVPLSEAADPPIKDSIGTATVVSPAAVKYGLSTTDSVTGTVYLTGSLSDANLEIYLGGSIYDLGSFTPGSVPLTVSWGEASVGGTPDPLPMSSVNLSFPAATAPVKPLSCAPGGAVTGTATDYTAALALAGGDSTDGLAAPTDTASAVTLPDTSTVVTDLCAATGSGTISDLKQTGKAKLSLKVVGNGGNRFTSATVTLPKGITYKGKKSITEKFAATKSRTIKLSGLKATAKEAKTKAKSATVEITVVYADENGTTGRAGTSATGTAKVKL